MHSQGNDFPAGLYAMDVSSALTAYYVASQWPINSFYMYLAQNKYKNTTAVYTKTLYVKSGILPLKNWHY